MTTTSTAAERASSQRRGQRRRQSKSDEPGLAKAVGAVAVAAAQGCGYEHGSKNAGELPTGRVLVGDALERLRALPSGSVDTVITSPPYFLLRDYQVEGQIGLETHVDQWVGRLRAVFGEVARVLKPEGSLWLNLGDTYSRGDRYGAPAKSLLLGPERLLLALAGDGWIVRNKVVWAKPNGMPSSVGDRLACTHEPLYLLVRSERYFFDLDAIRVPGHLALRGQRRPQQKRAAQKYDTSGTRGHWAGPLAGNNSGLTAMKAEGRSTHVLGKNPGDVWTIPTGTFPGAHFACFPPGLVERPLLAGCPEKVCVGCGRAWRRLAAVRSLGRAAVKGALTRDCACGTVGSRPGIVLDPFFGAGTVGLVAERMGRDWIGIELNQDYAAMAASRITEDRTKTKKQGAKDARESQDAGNG